MPERKPYVAYTDDLSEFAIFDWKMGALEFAVKHRWNVRPLKFDVPLRQQLSPTVPAPVGSSADGDIVDAEIDYSEAYTELAEMRLAVLRIHGGYGDTITAVCHECLDSDGDPTSYPCPTARALGVTS